MNISSNISSIQSHQTMMNGNAHNVANVNTDRFIPSTTTMHNSADSVTAHTRSSSDNGSLKSQTDLAKELPDQMIVEDVTAVNVTAIRTKDEMLGTLLDIKA